MPVVVLDDGRVLAESNAIIVYFAEGTDYLPADRFERAKVLQWLFFDPFARAKARWRGSGGSPGSPYSLPPLDETAENVPRRGAPRDSDAL